MRAGEFRHGPGLRLNGSSLHYVCVHGHFYQPPRENPWLELIELQDSAYPYHDWNERINAECYATNSAARMLDAKDRIRRIANNYESISFNFGPTLLSWMEAAAPAFREKGVELETEARLEVGDPHGDAAKLTDFIEVIRWYQSFIYVKLCRATSSHAEEQIERDAALGAFPKDSDGTAKVALVAIDRSIAAWAGLREMLPEQDDAILDLLRQLARLRSATETMFPQARSFVRPGFDGSA